MSLTSCDHCYNIIDTDEDPESCVTKHEYEGIEEDCFICENCRERLENKR